VNTVANVMSNFTQSAVLRLVPAPGATFTGPIIGDLVSSDETWGKYVHLGPLQYGQSRDVTLQMKLPEGEAPYLEAVVAYPNMISGKEIRISEKGIGRNATFESVVGGLRNKTISVGFKAVSEADECN